MHNLLLIKRLLLFMMFTILPCMANVLMVTVFVVYFYLSEPTYFWHKHLAVNIHTTSLLFFFFRVNNKSSSVLHLTSYNSHYFSMGNVVLDFQVTSSSGGFLCLYPYRVIV